MALTSLSKTTAVSMGDGLLYHPSCQTRPTGDCGSHGGTEARRHGGTEARTHGRQVSTLVACQRSYGREEPYSPSLRLLSDGQDAL
jgi:hypothetical protein